MKPIAALIASPSFNIFGATIAAGYQDFADRWEFIIGVFEEAGVTFALELPSSEIAAVHWTTRRNLEAIGHRAGFASPPDPSHLIGSSRSLCRGWTVLSTGHGEVHGEQLFPLRNAITPSGAAFDAAFSARE